MNTFNCLEPTGIGFGLLHPIAVLCLAAGGGIMLSGKVGEWLPWIAGGVLVALGLYHMVRRIRGRGCNHFHSFSDNSPGDGEAARGPHGGQLVKLRRGYVEILICRDHGPRFRLFFYDKLKKAQSVPTHATVRVETVRSDNTHQIFELRSQGEYLESLMEVPEPQAFNAVIQASHGSHCFAHEVCFSHQDRAAAQKKK